LQRGKTHLFPSTGLAAVVTSFLGAGTTFADLALPFAAVAMDSATALPHVLREGPLLPALLASAAIPGLFPPVQIGSLQLYDGGLVANVPMRQAVAMGARSLVVLDCSFPGHLPDPPATIAEVLLYTAMVAMRSQAVLEAPLAAAEVPVIYLPGPEPQRVSPLDFHHTGELIEGAYEAARSFLEEVDVTGPGLYGSPSRHGE
jgi:NTE family protein